jgi:hypothetical protein
MATGTTPCTHSPALAPRAPQEPAPRWGQALLSDPTLAGMSRQQLRLLTRTLTPDGDTRRGRPPRLAFPEQVLATVHHLRVALAAEPLPYCSAAAGPRCTAPF